MAVVLPARMFKESFAKRGLAPVVLSRAVGAAATATSALIPLKQLRSLYGRCAGCCDCPLRAVCRVQHGKPDFGDRLRGAEFLNAAHKAG